MHLGMEAIAAVRKRDLSESDKKEIELEENIKRKDLTWQEEVTGLLQLYEIKQNRYGKRTGSKFGEAGFGKPYKAYEWNKMKTPTRILVGGPEVTSAFVLMALALARRAMMRGASR